jgi:Abnormal spindle-like microcephaly-assoc'd, ASPM-SPD-2-Hydin/Beta-propeller repeat
VVGLAGPGFPTTTGAYQSNCPDNCVFLAELNPTGSSLVRSTYLGSGNGFAPVVAVDTSDNVYLAGLTDSASFPLVNSIQSCSPINGASVPNGNFLAEFSPTGALTFSTRLGFRGSDDSGSPTLALDSSGNAYVAGDSQASLLLQSPIDANPPLPDTESVGGIGGRPFVSEVDGSTHTLLFSSFVGEQSGWPSIGFAGDAILGIAVDSNGNIYLAGLSEEVYPESLFPVFNALQPYLLDPACPGQTDCFLIDGFIIKISPAAGAAAATSPGGVYFYGSDYVVEPVGATSPPQTVTVYDLGTDPLTVSNVAINGDFAIQSNNCGTVPSAGGSCAITMTFSPTKAGTRTGTLTITDSSVGSPHMVLLVGTGGQPAAVPSPTTLSFGNQTVGITSAARSVTVTNSGALNTTITQVHVSGDFNETNNCPLSLTPAVSCTIQVAFTPTTTGVRNGTLTITDSAPNSPQTVSLAGTGVPPGLGLGVASGGSSSATVAAGATAKYSLSIGGAGMSGTASLSCTGAPADAICTVPATENLSVTTATSFTVSVTTAAQTAGASRPTMFHRSPWLWALAMAGWVALPVGMSKKQFGSRYLSLLTLFLLMFLLSCGGSASGGGSNAGGTPAGTYTITVAADVGTTHQAIPLTLTVQ